MQHDSVSPVRSPRKPATQVLSLRLTERERQNLCDRAGSVPLGAYVRNLILAPETRQERRRVRNPLRDDQSLARVLAALGQSRLSANLNQLAKAVNVGVLPVTPETERAIDEACSAVRAMRADLVMALGLEDIL